MNLRWLVGWLLVAWVRSVNATETNLVPNSGFEAGDAGAPWSVRAPVYSLTTNSPHAGQRCLQYVNAAPARVRIAERTIELPPLDVQIHQRKDP
jgi:hypothetical protein